MNRRIIDIGALESDPAYEPAVSALLDKSTQGAMKGVFRGLGRIYENTKAEREFVLLRIQRLIGILQEAESNGIDIFPHAASGLAEFAQCAHKNKEYEASFAFAANAIWLLRLTKKDSRDCTEEESRRYGECRQRMFDIVLEAAKEIMRLEGTSEPTPFMKNIMQNYRIVFDPAKLMQGQSPSSASGSEPTPSEPQ